MVDPRRRITALMKRVRQKNQLPSSIEIVRETFENLGYVEGQIDPTEILSKFDEMLRKLFEETLPTLERYEERSFASGIPREFIEEFPESFDVAEGTATQQGFREGFVKLFDELYPMFRRAFLSVQQGRMTRGGKDFELQIEGLLDLAQIPYHKQEKEHHTDLILPNLETHEQNKTISIVVSVKRTLRERWQEVAEELYTLRSPNVFLFTADEKITDNHISRICDQHNIYLVVWDEVKATKFAQKPLVLGYTEWATKRLAVLQQNWS